MGANMDAPERRRNPFWRMTRIVRARPRLFLAILLGVAIALLSPSDWRLPTRALVAWDIAAGIYLVFAFRLMNGCDHSHIRHRAAFQDEGRFTILALIVASTLASLVAILAELSGGNRQPGQLALAGLTIFLSWTLMHTIFALHYAHDYYGEDATGKASKRGGLSFPGEEAPDYWDFVYFSFVIGMTSQVSDVAVTQRSLRRLVTIHGAVSFIFNVTLLALMVNIAASTI
jgi:uncharacterized membrane protein